MVGIIIGKGGDMIRKIQEETGSRVQFKPETDEGGSERPCTIVGSDEGNEQAAQMIKQLIENTVVRGCGWG